MYLQATKLVRLHVCVCDAATKGIGGGASVTRGAVHVTRRCWHSTLPAPPSLLACTPFVTEAPCDMRPVTCTTPLVPEEPCNIYTPLCAPCSWKRRAAQNLSATHVRAKLLHDGRLHCLAVMVMFARCAPYTELRDAATLLKLSAASASPRATPGQQPQPGSTRSDALPGIPAAPFATPPHGPANTALSVGPCRRRRHTW